MEDGLLSLKWNNHKSTFFHILSEVRGKHTYTDATLACEGKFFPVHKLVMSTCSDYFAEIFEKTPCKNPVVVLKDIKKSDLEALLDYMYIGEVDVRQSELAGLIKAAECLRIKGLAVPDEDPTKAQKKGPSSVPERREDSPPAKRKRRESGGDRGRAPSPIIPRGSSQSSSSHPPSTSSVPSQAPSQLSSVPESHVPSQSMPPPPSISQETRQIDSGRGRQDSHPPQSQPHPSQISSLKPSPESLRSPPSGGPESSHPSITSPRSSDPSLLPVQMIKVEVDDGDNSGVRDSHGDREDGSEMDGDEEETSNDFSEYQSHGGEIEKEEHDQMDSYGADQIPGPSGLQGAPPVLSWGEEGEAGFPHNLFGGDDPASQQALQGPDLARRAWESLSESLVARLTSSAPPPRPPHRLGGSQLHSGGAPVTSDRPHLCPLCPYRATTRDSLARHIRTHTGERPFKCSYCPYRAIQKSDVDKHIRRRHKDAVANWPGLAPTSCISNVLSNVSNLTYTQPATTAWQSSHARQSVSTSILTDSTPSYTSPPNSDI
ncbi:longitudinals lacking protein, isoforms H/M/V isoform X3 [Procambarus clarkii]|uniref:longitudinals lacking protein, isoforms H/M/V isoform X3 n=1 Tax=Procambarus clarkii TaxID=6728 RepID=UPI001E673278|nr:longitudinals lacking protein, isoforms H/M/V-like isoform X3 [Procambarus clarkii]XP_045598513.1 longitudinals lacking protein, isoforms H/M/V-like isoform X3 [Procambarus clarkii]